MSICESGQSGDFIWNFSIPVTVFVNCKFWNYFFLTGLSIRRGRVVQGLVHHNDVFLKVPVSLLFHDGGDDGEDLIEFVVIESFAVMLWIKGGYCESMET